MQPAVGDPTGNHLSGHFWKHGCLAVRTTFFLLALAPASIGKDQSNKGDAHMRLACFLEPQNTQATTMRGLSACKSWRPKLDSNQRPPD